LFSLVKQERLKTAWEYKFSLFLDENLKSLDDFNQQLITGFQLFKFVGEFRTKAVDTCKAIIDELHLPPSERTHTAKELSSIEESDQTLEKTFMINNCIIRVTWAERSLQDIPDLGEHYVYTEKLIKSYGHGK